MIYISMLGASLAPYILYQIFYFISFYLPYLNSESESCSSVRTGFGGRRFVDGTAEHILPSLMKGYRQIQ